MNRWTLALVLIALWIPGSGPSAWAEDSLKAALAQSLDIKENAFAKLSDDPKVSEMDVPDRSRQVSLAGLIRLSSSGEEFLQELEEAQNGSLLGPSQAEGFFGRPATAKDLANLTLPDGDFEVLADCKPANCKFKLSREGIEKAQSIDWKNSASQNQFSEYFKNYLAQYVETFRQEGAKALIVYDDKPKPFALKDGAESLRARMTLGIEFCSHARRPCRCSRNSGAQQLHQLPRFRPRGELGTTRGATDHGLPSARNLTNTCAM